MYVMHSILVPGGIKMKTFSWLTAFVQPLRTLRGSLMVLALSLAVLIAWGPHHQGAAQSTCDPCMSCGAIGVVLPMDDCLHCSTTPIAEVCQCCEALDGSAQCCYKV